MEPKEAMKILLKLMEKYPLTDEEKEAVAAALSVLDCAALGQNQLKSYIKSKKTKRDKSMEL